MEERLARLHSKIYTPVAALKATAYITKEPVPFKNRFCGEKRELAIGERWGSLWDCAWMHFEAAVPEFAGGKKAVFLLDVGGEGCVFDDSGAPFRGITNKDSFYSFELGMPGKTVVPLCESAIAGQKVDFWVDCGANDLFGERRDWSFDSIGILHEAHLAICDEPKRQLYYDLEVILYLKNATEDEALKSELTRIYDLAHETWENDTEKALELTKSALDCNSESDFEITALGHAHIDLAWLWPIRETKRKAARTFATLMRNSEIYGEYLFGVSQPQMLEWVKEEHPKLYAQMKRLYNDGRLELQGGFWVESDTNVPCGESLVRQMLYGKKFFREEFGYEQEILWIPDVFGYTAQLPQIMKHFGVKYFLTIKMSWNAVNRFPHSTFNWIGLDGSNILTHMPPEGNYNSAARPESLLITEKKYMEREIDNRAMMLYGIGDGGGGPGEEHLERLRREYDLYGVPKVKQGFAIDFFRDIEKDRAKFPSYSGELYLEKHQGTYTTQSRTKRFNRLLEQALHDAELLSVLCDSRGLPYPSDRLNRIWKEVLLYQFHDIIPGSSIKRVYDEAEVRYAEMNLLLKDTNAQSGYVLKESEGECWFNPSPFDFEGYTDSGEYIKAPAMGFGKVSECKKSAIADESTLDNGIIKVIFNENGGIDSIYDGEQGYEFLDGEGNILNIYDDAENGWEVPADYKQNACIRATLTSKKHTTENGVARMLLTYTAGNSTITQTASLAPDSRRIDFHTVVDWNETHKMLRVSFPSSVKSDNAKCGIQYGCIDRPTHTRDSFAKAKKEVCAHRWIDISDGKKGVALMSDCKYGYRIWDCVLDMNLLRSSMYPGVDADKGRQEFTYSVYIHEGDFKNGLVKQGYELCAKPIALPYSPNSELIGRSIISTDNPIAVIDWVKKAESGNGYILRVYDCSGEGCRFSLCKGLLDFGKVFVCDGDERIVCEADERIALKPFEFTTLLIQ